MPKRALSILLVLGFLAGFAAAQDSRLLDELFGPAHKATFPDIALNRTSGGPGQVYSEAILSGAGKGLLQKNFHGAGVATFVVDHSPVILGGNLPPALAKTLGRDGAAAAVSFAVKAVSQKGSSLVAMPAAMVKRGQPKEGVGYLVVSGPCAGPVADPKAGHIYVACGSPDSHKEWVEVPLNASPKVKNTQGDFVTGRAGFFKSGEQWMFFVEYYAWPDDPVEVGG